jgi:hypothetical protein
MVRVLPILFDDMGLPKDSRLHGAACFYYSRHNTGEVPDFSKFLKVWVTVKSGVGVIGLMGMQASPDMTVWHSDDGKAYSKMFNRVQDYCADRGVKSILVHMTDAESEKVKSLMEKSGATPADRWWFNLCEED